MHIKIITVMLLSSFAYAGAFAQTSEASSQSPKSLFQKKEASRLNPSFGLVDFKYSYTTLFNRDLHGVEMNMGVVFNDHWLTGLSVHAAATPHLSLGNPPIDVVNPRYSYFFVGWNNALVIAPHSLVNVSIPLRLGLGGVTYSDRYQQGVMNTGRIAQDYFFVAESGLDVNINLTTHLGFSFGASYRFAEGMQLAGSSADFQQWFLNAGLRLRIH